MFFLFVFAAAMKANITCQEDPEKAGTKDLLARQNGASYA